MDIVNQRVSGSQGATAFGTDSYQQIYSQYKSSFTFISGTLSYGESITLPVPQAVDSCWTTGNIFRLDNGSGIVKKTSFSNELQSSLALNSPFSLSVIQYSVPMEDPPDKTDECLGCWIVDGTSVVKTDNNLNVMFEITNITSPTLICTNHNDNGCYVLDLGVGIYAFSSSGDLVGSNSYTNSAVIGFLSNSIGELFVLTETELLKFVNTNGSIDLSVTYDMSPVPSTMAIGCFDIDTNTDILYVAAGDNTNIESIKFNSSGGLINTSSSSGKFPHILKVSQHPSSSAFFIIADDRQIEFVNSSSSSSGGTSSSSISEDSSSSSSLGYSSSSSSSLGYSSSSSSSEGYSSSSSSTSSSSSGDYLSSSSSSWVCSECCGCDSVKLAVNINGTPAATDISDLDGQYANTTASSTGLSTAQSYVGGGSHYNGGGNEYCLFHPYAAIQDPVEKGCTFETGLADNNGCLNLEANDFDIRLAIYIESTNISSGSSLISKWSNPSNLPDSGRSWVLGYTDGLVSPVLGNFGFYFAWSDDGTNFSEIDFEFGVGVNPEPVVDEWLEVRIARVGSEIAAYFDGTKMEITSSVFNGGTAGATFYPIDGPMLIGNNLETVASAFTDGFSGYMDYFFVQIGGDVCLESYTPEIAAFSAPDYIGNLGDCNSSSSSSSSL